MSEKQRTSSVLKSMGAAGLAAATVVSGLAFGPAAATAAPQSSTDASSTQSGPGPWITANTSSTGGYLAVQPAAQGGQGLVQVTRYQTQAEAVAGAEQNGWDKWVFPAVGSAGEIRSGNSCLFLLTPKYTYRAGAGWLQYSGGYVFRSCDLANDGYHNKTFTMNRDGSIRSAWTAQLTNTGPNPPALSVYVSMAPNGAWWSSSALNVGPIDVSEPSNPAAIVGQTGPVTTLERGTDTPVEALFKTSGTVSGPKATVEFTAPAGTTFASGQTTISGSYQKPGADPVHSAMTLTGGTRSADGTKYTYTFDQASTWTLPDASLMRWDIEVTTPAGAAAATGSMSAKLVGTATEGSYDTTATTATTIDAPVPVVGIVASSPSGVAGTTSTTGTAKVQAEQVVGPMTLTAPTGTTFADVTVRHVRDDVEQGNYQVTYNTDRTAVTIEGPADGSGAHWGTSNQYADYTLDIPAGTDPGTITGGTAKVTANGTTLAEGSFGVSVTEDEATQLTATGSFSSDLSENATISGTAQKGATVTLYQGPTVIDTTRASEQDGSYSFSVTAPGAGKQQFQVSQTIAGDESPKVTVELDYGTPVTITRPSTGAVVPGDTTVTGTGTPGSEITVTAAGKNTTTTVRPDGTYTATIELTPSNTITEISVSQHAKGNLTTDAAVRVTANARQQLRDVVFTTPADRSYIPLQSTVVAGTATPYATLRITNQWGTVVGTPTADKDGRWSFSRVYGPAAEYFLSATQTLSDGRTQTTDGFNLAPLGAFRQLTIQNPNPTTYTANTPLTLTGTATPGATITAVNQWGTTMFQVRANQTNGTWSITREYGPTAEYTLQITQTAPNGQTDRITGFTHAPSIPWTPMTVTSDDNGDAYRPGPHYFTGRGTPNATITAKNQWGTPIGTATVNTNGTWAFERNLGPTADYTITFTQTRGTNKNEVELTLLAPAFKPFTLTTPTENERYTPGKTTPFTGTASPYATITATTSRGGTLFTTTADKHGNWTYSRAYGPTNVYEITFTQTPYIGTPDQRTGFIWAPEGTTN